jgi:hypothetical protein
MNLSSGARHGNYLFLAPPRFRTDAELQQLHLRLDRTIFDTVEFVAGCDCRKTDRI